MPYVVDCGDRKASMKPGQVYPGYHRIVGKCPYLRTASMKPGQVYPGYQFSIPIKFSANCSFNEAGASIPRIPLIN